MLIRTFLLILALTTSLAAQPARDLSVEEMQVEQRVALVIGNGAYQSDPLRNPVSDAKAMANALKTCGFNVIEKVNCTKVEMKEAIRAFGDQIRAGGVGLFYFAGHGVQMEGENYLVPIDADVQREHEIEDECIDTKRVLREMGDARNRVNIVAL